MKETEILLVVRWPVGGIRTFIKYVYRNFPRLRFRVVLVAPDLPETRCLIEDLGPVLRFCHLLSSRPAGNQIAGTVFGALRRGEFDLVHSHGFTSGLCAALPAFVTRTPHVLTSHDILQESQFQGVTGSLKKTALSSLLPLASRIHSVSHDAQENLLEFVPILQRCRRRLSVIPNGIDIGQFAGGRPPRAFRRELSLPADAWLIGFFGRFMSQKGFRYLTDALHLLIKRPDLPRPPFLLSFGGGGFHREEKAQVDRLGLSDRIIFLPFVDDISASLRGVDAVAMPSLWEACPLLPMEALVSGTPLVGTDAVGLREVLRDTPCRKVPRGDAPSLADALFQEMLSPSRDAIEEYRESAIRRFDVRRTAASLEALLCSAMGSRKKQVSRFRMPGARNAGD